LNLRLINAAMTRGNETGKNTRKTAARSARLAAALRANLRRRKAQERGRGESAAAEAGGPSQNDKNR
jgi:hypothetical protein